jgi:hypothetical protein
MTDPVLAHAIWRRIRIDTAARNLQVAATMVDEAGLATVAAEIRAIAEGLAKPSSAWSP